MIGFKKFSPAKPFFYLNDFSHRQSHKVTHPLYIKIGTLLRINLVFMCDLQECHLHVAVLQSLSALLSNKD